MKHNDVALLSLLIVEDEAAVRRGLRNKLPWEEVGVRIMADAQNAEEALEIIKSTPPDIILLDMRMPGMGGMKLLEILRKDFVQIKVIILSGHADFEYMRQALKCGAVDYLLKPVIKEELRTAIIKVSEMIALERQSLQEKTYQSIVLKESVPLLKANLLNKLLLGIKLDAADIVKRLSYLGVNLDFNYYSMAIIRIMNYDDMKQAYMNDTSIAYFALENIVNETFGSSDSFVGFRSSFIENEYIYIFGSNESNDIHCVLKNGFTSVTKNIMASNRLEISVSISDIYTKISDIPLAYRKASHVWGKKKSGEMAAILFSEDFYDELQLSNLLSVYEIINITDLIENNDKQQLISIINQIFQRADELNIEPIEIYRKIAAKIYFSVERIIENNSIQQGVFLDIKVSTYNEMIDKYTKPEDFKFGVIKAVIEMSDFIAKKRKSESSNIVSKVKDYIEKYFFEDISLEFISKKFFINATYFCEQFKKETGQSFNKYLNTVRIEKAKELLRNQDMKPSDVAEIVGFKELAYFCLVFKKYVGVTPTKYKEA